MVFHAHAQREGQAEVELRLFVEHAVVHNGSQQRDGAGSAVTDSGGNFCPGIALDVAAGGEGEAARLLFLGLRIYQLVKCFHIFHGRFRQFVRLYRCDGFGILFFLRLGFCLFGG